MICDVGINDFDGKVKVNGKLINSYYIWKSMIHRCYNPKNHNYKNYGAKGVKVCCEWKKFSNFKRWFDENYIEGFHLDKDIKGNGKIYSPQTCLFVSASENIMEEHKRRDCSYMKGNKFGCKEKEFYSENPVFRNNFKRTCINQGWNFEDFEEIFSHVHTNGKNKRNKFYYKYRGDLNCTHVTHKN